MKRLEDLILRVCQGVGYGVLTLLAALILLCLLNP
jgi:hypothetical protein